MRGLAFLRLFRSEDVWGKEQKMKRSEVREAVFFLTFEKMFGNSTADEILDTAYEADVFEINEDVEKFFKAVDEKKDRLDEVIAKFSETRQISRIPKVSMAVLRIAVYEMLFDDTVPDNVAISEAVILTKKFAYEQDVQFVNGLLGAFFRSREDKQ